MKLLGRLAASAAIAIAVSSYGVRASDHGCPDKCKDNTQCPGGCCTKDVYDFCEDESGWSRNNECENTNLVVGCNSCFGTNACKEISGLSSIGSYSCRDGDEQCRKITSTTIGDFSCLGGSEGEACKEVSNSVIGSHSCQKSFACQASGSTIGDDSCRDGQGACRFLDNYRVGPHSCKGRGACYNLLTRLGQAKDGFVENGGTCSDGTIPAHDIQADTCVGESMCNECQYYLGCLPPGRCNEDLSPEDVLASYEGSARCYLCYEAGYDELNIKNVNLLYRSRILEGGTLTNVDEDREGNLFGGTGEYDTNPSLEHNAMQFSCDQIGNLIAKQLTERLIQDVLDRFDFSMGAIRFELVDEGEDYCRMKIGYPPSVSDRPTKVIANEFKAEVRRLIREEDMLKSLRVKYPTVFELVEEIVISDGKDGGNRNKKPKRSKKSKAKKRGKGKKRSKGNKSSKDTRNLRAM